LGFGSLKTLEFGLLYRTYVRVGGRTFLFLVRTYVRGPLDVRLQIVQGYSLGTTRTFSTFQNTLWIILKCTLQPLDFCVNSTRCMLGLSDVYFFGELVALLNYKYPLALSFSHALSCPRLLVDFL
jgi:hypothetical protein